MGGQTAVGRTALLTGASSGFGLRTALLLARQDWVVYAGFRDPAMAGELDSHAKEAGVAGLIRPVRLDVTDEREIRDAVALVKREAGRLDALINNAGYAAGGFVEELPLARWREQFETNVFGAVAVTREALALLRESRGRIVFISSISGRMGFPALSPYVSSKHALEGFGEALRLEMAPFGVSVSIVEPGPYQTAIWRKSMASLTPPAPDSPYAGLYARIKPLLDRSASGGGDPDRVAWTVARALAARKPKLRYLPGWGERWTIGAKSWLPWSWIESAIMRALGVRR